MRSKEIERIRKQSIIITAKQLIYTHHGSISTYLVTYYIAHIYIPAYNNALFQYILAVLTAFYAEKGYYLWLIWLLDMGKKVTTYQQKGYYISEFALLILYFPLNSAFISSRINVSILIPH